MKRKAFTLIELIIVIVVLGILATIAIVGYRAVIDRANQASAENAAKSFDRQLGAMAAFGMESNPTMNDPNRGQLVLDVLQDANNTAASGVIKDIPDSDVVSSALTANSLRALVWNGAGWTRLCNAAAGTSPVVAACSNAATVLSATGGVGKIPTGMTSATTTPVRLCFAFRKGGQTVYLGLSDKANIRGTTSAVVTTACSTSAYQINSAAPAAITTPVYSLPASGTGAALVATIDGNW